MSKENNNPGQKSDLEKLQSLFGDSSDSKQSSFMNSFLDKNPGPQDTHSFFSFSDIQKINQNNNESNANNRSEPLILETTQRTEENKELETKPTTDGKKK